MLHDDETKYPPRADDNVKRQSFVIDANMFL